MKLIKQRHNQDCGIASLAMFMKVSYEEAEHETTKVLNKFFHRSGMNIEDLALVIKDGYNKEPVVLRTIAPNVPAIVSVPSLGTKRMFHWIYFDGKRVYDPSNYEVYKTKDFNQDFPVSDAICLKETLDKQGSKHNWYLPSHLCARFDFNYIKWHREHDNG